MKLSIVASRIEEKILRFMGATDLDIEIRRVESAIHRTDYILQDILRAIPPGRACCNSCYLTAAHPEYYELEAKQERRHKWLAVLRERRRRRDGKC